MEGGFIMAFGIKDCTKQSPCPLCGKDHWCGWMPVEYGKLLLCHTEDAKGIVMGRDGRNYVRVGTSRSDVAMFEEESQYNTRMGDLKAARQLGKPVKASSSGPATLTILDGVSPLRNETLDKIYKKFLSMLVLEDRHREYLKKEGWSDELIEKYQIKSLPIDDFKRYNLKNVYFSKNRWRKSICEDLVKKFGSLRGVPGFYRKDNVWKIKSRSGILFPMFDENRNLYRLRVRMDFEDMIAGKTGNLYTSSNEGVFVEPLKGAFVIEGDKKVYEKTGGKYRNFSSFREDEEFLKQGFVKNIYTDGCQANNCLSLYCKPEDDFYCVYITEGEKKSIVGNEILKAPFISVPGVSSFNLIKGKMLEYLKNKGTQCFIIAFDADKATNEAVMKAEQKAIEALKAEGLFVGIAEWDAIHGKGIDDLLINGHRPSFTIPQ